MGNTNDISNNARIDQPQMLCGVKVRRGSWHSAQVKS
jgi:hypothetical protein